MKVNVAAEIIIPITFCLSSVRKCYPIMVETIGPRIARASFKAISTAYKTYEY
jgi:hypothetical protein